MENYRDFRFNYISPGAEADRDFRTMMELLQDTKGPITEEDVAHPAKWKLGARPSMLELQILEDFPFWALFCTLPRAMLGEKRFMKPRNVVWVMAVGGLHANMAAQRLVIGALKGLLGECRKALQNSKEKKEKENVFNEAEHKDYEEYLDKVWEACKISVTACREACKKEATNYEMTRVLRGVIGSRDMIAVLSAHYLKNYFNHYEICYQKIRTLLRMLDDFVRVQANEGTEKELAASKAEMEAFRKKQLDSFKSTGPTSRTWVALDQGCDRLTYDLIVGTDDSVDKESFAKFVESSTFLQERLETIKAQFAKNPEAETKWKNKLMELESD